MHPTYTSDRPGDCPICNMKLVKREEPPAHRTPQHEDARAKQVLYWTDPMLPGYKSDQPGTSPMGMELVPVYEEDAGSPTSSDVPEGYTPIRVTPQKQQLIGVKTAVARRQPLTKTIRTVGRIAYDPELYQAEQEYLQALNALLRAHAATNPEVARQAERLVDSARLRLRLLGLSQDLIGEMTGWQEPDKRLLLADPTGAVWLYAPVYEFELSLIRPGQTITVELPAIPGKRLEGAIRSIDSVLDPTTRSARVRAVVVDAERLLKPEMYVNASIVVSLGEVLTIPEAAVFQTGTAQLVFVDKGEGIFEPREVVVGVNADGFYELKRGVAEGEVVVTSGNFLIDSESRLKAALEDMTGGAHQHGP